jgi:hypothetical protein
VTILSAGTCTVQATQAGNATYSPATPVSQSFQVAQGSETITFGTLSNQPYGTAPFPVSAIASSGLAVSFTSQTQTICTMSGATVTLVTVGTCTIQATQGGNIDYLAATAVNQSFQVVQGPQTITFGSIANQVFGTGPLTMSATASSGLTVSFNSQTALVCTASGTSVALISAGTCTIQATQGGNMDYLAATPVNQSFQVTQAPQTITFGTLSNQTYGATPFGVSATASSGLAVSFNSQTAAVCTVSGVTVTIVSAGTCTIQATQGGNANYLPATAVNQSFQVAKANQTISFGTIANRLLGASPFTVSATASSGLAVSFNSQTPAICTASGASVTLAAVGTCTIQATQAGNTDFNGATSVNQSFQVTALTAQTLTAGSTSSAPGGAFSIPVTLALSSGVNVDSLTFGIQITPVGNAPTLTGSLSFTTGASVSAIPFTTTEGTANEISVVWASIATPFSGVVALGSITGTLPAGAVSGQTYSVAVTGLSAANGSGTNPVTVSAGPNATITVATTYLVGDAAPYKSDTAPNFGDGNINILDLVQILFAVNNVPGFSPAACSDRLDAMDVYPPDTATTRGGDGILDVRDLVVELFRANNLDPARPVRASLGGCLTNSSKGGAKTVTARSIAPRLVEGSGPDGALWFGNPEPFGASQERVPVYLEAKHDLTGVALTFAVGDEHSSLAFVAAVMPSLANSQQPGVAAVAWLDGIGARAGVRTLLGYVEAPAGASAGLQIYGLSAVRLADNREVRLGAPGTVGQNR